MFLRVTGSKVVWIALAVLCVLSLGGEAYAQSATIVGTVKDQSGAVLPGVAVTSRNTGTGLTRSVLSNETGDYSVPLLQIGSYEVQSEFAGFKTQVKSGITLKVDDRVRIDFLMEVGELSERIVVTESAPLVQSENASIGNVIDHAKIVELPLNGREFYSLAQLNPAVYAPAQNSTLGFRGGFNVAGAAETSNSYILDGIENMDPISNQPAHRPSIDTIQEFKVLTGTYSAEYGRHSGGHIIVTTKSGTNELHGTAYEFYRNSKMDARDFFAAAVNPFRRNNFGGTLGGPIARDRTFVFGGYEGLRSTLQDTVLGTVPSAAMRTGDLSDLLNASNTFTGRRTVINDPRTGQAFPNNIIPASRIDRVARELIDVWYPQPNVSGSRNYRSTGVRDDTNDQFNVKIDHRISDKNNLSGGYQFMNLRPFLPLGNISLCGSRVLPGHGCTDRTKTQSAVLTDIHIFSPNLIHEIRLGYTRLTALRIPEAGTKGVSQRLAIPGLPGADFKFNEGGPQVGITGFSTIGPSSGNPQGRTDNDYHIVDTWSINRANHGMKAGVDLRMVEFNSFHAAGRPGAFTFNGFMTGYAFADFLLGFPRTASRNTGVPYTVTRDKSVNFFFQDDWKVSDKLTLNLGVRWEFNAPINERKDELASLDINTNRIRVSRCGTAFVDANNNLVFNKGTCDKRNIWTMDRNNFAPRVGIAYRPLANNTFVIRTGYGVYYDVFVSGNGLSGLWRGLPYRITTNLTSSTTNPITLSDPFTPAPGRAVARFTQPSIEENLVTPYVQQWSFGVQKEMSENLVLETTYMGSQGTKLFDDYPINSPRPGSGGIDARRPFQPWGSFSHSGNFGRSWFNSLQVRLEQRAVHGVSGLVSYTWGRALDTGTGAATGSDGDGGVQDPFNLRGDKSRSAFDVQHRFVSSYIIELPFGKGRRFMTDAPRGLDLILGGWELSGIVTFQTGTPFTPTISNDNANTGTTNRPHLTGNWKLDNPTPDRWFNKEAFCFQASCGLAPFTFGNAGRNIIEGPPRKNWDFSLLKNFRFKESQRIQFRAEMFNFANHPNFWLPGASVNLATGGTISRSDKGRTVQLALKYVF